MNENFARIGFVGCGSHATNNLYPMLKYARIKLMAICDLNETLARRNAVLFGAERVYTDVDQMLASEDLDGLIVVGPYSLHYEAAKKALVRGIPVFTEKPPAPGLAEAEELVNLARANRTFLMTGFMKRHGMPYAKAREMIASGQFELASGLFKYAHWNGTDLKGMLYNMSIHIIDLALSFFGPAASVTSHMYRSERALSLFVTLRFQSDRLAQLWLDSSQPRIQERMELSGAIDGGNALIIVDNVQHMEVHKQGTNGIDLAAPNLYDIRPTFQLEDIQVWRPDYGIPNLGQSRQYNQGFAGEIREFADAILEKREPYPGTSDVLPALRVIEAILSAPNGSVDLA